MNNQSCIYTPIIINEVRYGERLAQERRGADSIRACGERTMVSPSLLALSSGMEAY